MKKKREKKNMVSDKRGNTRPNTEEWKETIRTSVIFVQWEGRCQAGNTINTKNAER